MNLPSQLLIVILGWLSVQCSVVLLRQSQEEIEVLLEITKEDGNYYTNLPEAHYEEGKRVEEAFAKEFGKDVIIVQGRSTLTHQGITYELLATTNLDGFNPQSIHCFWMSLQEVLFGRLAQPKVCLQNLPGLFEDWIKNVCLLGYAGYYLTNPPIFATIFRFGPHGKLQMLVCQEVAECMQQRPSVLVTKDPAAFSGIKVLQRSKRIMALGYHSIAIYRANPEHDGTLRSSFQHNRHNFHWLNFNECSRNKFQTFPIPSIYHDVSGNVLLDELRENLEEMHLIGHDSNGLKAIWAATWSRVVDGCQRILNEILIETTVSTHKIAYNPRFMFNKEFHTTDIELVDLMPVDVALVALKNHPKSRVMLANFADNFQPGSHYDSGKSIEEADTFRRTTLPFIMDIKLGFRNEKKNLYPITPNPLQTFAIYSDSVSILRQGAHKDYEFLDCGPEELYHVQVCSVPRFNPYDVEVVCNMLDNTKVFTPRAMLTDAMKKVIMERIAIQFQLAVTYGAKILVTGAYGVGDFPNDLEEIVDLHKKVLAEYNGAVHAIYFSIPTFPDKSNPVMDVFRAQFEKPRSVERPEQPLCQLQ